MPHFLTSPFTWLRRRATWSNSRQSWEERLGVLVAAAGAVLLWHYRDRLDGAWQVGLWGLLLVGVAVLLRRGWLKLFGPVLFYELVRVARRRRYFLLRGLYVVVLALVFLWMYFLWSMRPGSRGELSPQEMAQLAEMFFTIFMYVQFSIVALLTPALTGGAVAEEKDRKTLEFLLATDLRNREIVLSKLAARLANLTLIVLAGLPVLSALQFFGGIDPGLLLSSFAALGVTMFSLTCLGVLFSVLLQKPRDAIMLTYLAVAGYLALSAVSLLLLYFPTVVGLPIWFGSDPWTVGHLVEGFNAGNLIVLLFKAERALGGNQTLPTVLPELLRDYALFHGLVGLACATVAVLRLRVVALRQPAARSGKAGQALRLWRRPRPGNQPMLWKELTVEPSLRLGWIGRVIAILLMVVSFLPAVWIIADHVHGLLRFYADGSIRHETFERSIHAIDFWRNLGEEINEWLRIVGTAVAVILLIAVAVRAAGTFTSERARQTLDDLLTTPLESRSILFAKWFASIFCVRWAWLWLGLIGLLGVVTGGLHPLAGLLLLVAWFIYAAVFAGIGVWFSLVCTTTLRATMWTLVTVVFVAGGHWLLSVLCCFLPVGLLMHGPGDSLEWLLKVQLGQTPPVVLGVFAFTLEDFVHGHEFVPLFISSLFGVICWAVAAGVLWSACDRRFRVLAERVPLRGSGATNVGLTAGLGPARRPEAGG